MVVAGRSRRRKAAGAAEREKSATQGMEAQR